jgi:hypothetical protein
VSTTAVFSGDGTTVTLTAVFERLLDTYEADDYKIKQSSTMDALWANGMIIGSEMQYHGFSNTDRGAFRMFIPAYYIPTPTSALRGAAVGMMVIISGLLALFI